MKVLLLGGTAEARELADVLAGEVDLVSSLAGRVRDPRLPAGEVRLGGFGGAPGLAEWLVDHRIDAVVDATHPFAVRMSGNAARAADGVGVPIVHLRRPGWHEEPGDNWSRVSDMAAAAAVLPTLGHRALLTVGRQGVSAFAGCRSIWCLIRAIDPPAAPLPPRREVILARGPFALADELRLLTDHRIDVLVTKDSGGASTSAKLSAAKCREIPVLMVNRPPLPPGADTVDAVTAAVAWVAARRL